MSRLPVSKKARVIDTPEKVIRLVDRIYRQDTSPGDLNPPLYIDIEGERLSREGTVSLMTVIVYSDQGLQRIYLIDVHTLGNAAFHTSDSRGRTLKAILESSEILKVFFDVRNDSDALFAHYDIRLKGVRDVQLMESANRRDTHSRRHVSGLSRCIESVLVGQERVRWKLQKERGERLWNPQKGGSYDAFNARPLSDGVIAYCVGDVQCLPALYSRYRLGTVRWQSMVAEESQNRVTVSQRADYKPHGPGRTLSPWSVEQNRLLDSWAEVNPSGGYFGAPPGEQDWDDLEFDNDYEDWMDDGNDYEDWTRAPWQGPPS